jgi:hypothetical protein
MSVEAKMIEGSSGGQMLVFRQETTGRVSIALDRGTIVLDADGLAAFFAAVLPVSSTGMSLPDAIAHCGALADWSEERAAQTFHSSDAQAIRTLLAAVFIIPRPAAPAWAATLKPLRKTRLTSRQVFRRDHAIARKAKR